MGKRCNININFDKKEFDLSHIKNFTDSFEKELKKILEQCVGVNERIFTPTDFDSVDLTQEELDSLLQERNR